MYGLPKDFNGDFFIGQILEMVCFNENQVYLHFGCEITVTIESAFSYQNDKIVSIPVRESDLMKMLGLSVSKAEGEKDGTLSLTFSNGETLKIYDISKQYESYSITYKGNRIIV